MLTKVMVSMGGRVYMVFFDKTFASFQTAVQKIVPDHNGTMCVEWNDGKHNITLTADDAIMEAVKMMNGGAGADTIQVMLIPKSVEPMTTAPSSELMSISGAKNALVDLNFSPQDFGDLPEGDYDDAFFDCLGHLIPPLQQVRVTKRAKRARATALPEQSEADVSPVVPAEIVTNVNFCELGETLEKFSEYITSIDCLTDAIRHTISKFKAFLQHATETGELTQFPPAAEFSLHEKKLWNKLQVTPSSAFQGIRLGGGEVRVGTRTGPVDASSTIVWLVPPDDVIEAGQFLCRMRCGAFDVFYALCPELKTRDLKPVRMRRYYQHRLSRLPQAVASEKGSTDGDRDTQSDSDSENERDPDGGDEWQHVSGKRKGPAEDTAGAAKSARTDAATTRGGAALAEVGAEAVCRDAVQELAWAYFVDAALSAEELLHRLERCATKYERATQDATPLLVHTLLGWIAEHDELRDCVLQEVPAADFRLRAAHFKASCVSRGWLPAHLTAAAGDTAAAVDAVKHTGGGDDAAASTAVDSGDIEAGPLYRGTSSDAPGVEYRTDLDEPQKDYTQKSVLDEPFRKQGSSRKSRSAATQHVPVTVPVHAVAVPEDVQGAPAERHGISALMALVLCAVFLLLGITYQLNFRVTPVALPALPSTQVPTTSSVVPPPSSSVYTLDPTVSAEDALGVALYTNVANWMSDPFREPKHHEWVAFADFHRALGAPSSVSARFAERVDARARDIVAVFDSLPVGEFLEIMKAEVADKIGNILKVEQDAYKTAIQKLQKEERKLGLADTSKSDPGQLRQALQRIMQEFHQSSALLPRQTTPSPGFAKQIASVKQAATSLWSKANLGSVVELERVLHAAAMGAAAETASQCEVKINGGLVGAC